MSLSLETQRLVLRPPVEMDLDGWAAFDADAEATRFFRGPLERAASWEGLATTAGMWALRGCGLFSVLEKQSGRWVGRVGPWHPEGVSQPELGWAITPSAWGRGYAVEAAAAAVIWAFEHLGWSDVIHRIDADNARSIAVALRLGSVWRKPEDHDGKVVQIYGQTREAWRSNRWV